MSALAQRDYRRDGVFRRPTDAEIIRHDTYGEPMPDPADLLVELVTARSLHGPTALSDAEITTRLRLRSTDDALRLVRQSVAARRLEEQLVGSTRRLSIPFAPIVPETAPRAAIAAVRAALPPPDPEPVATRAHPAPFVPRPTREIGPPVAAAPVPATPTPRKPAAAIPAPPPAVVPATAKPEAPATTEETVVSDTRTTAAASIAAAPLPAPKSRAGKGVHLLMEPAWHALFKARADALGVALNRVVLDAAIAGIDAPAPSPAATAPPAPTAPIPTAAIGTYDAIRVPLALFDLAGRAGQTIPAFLEDVIAAGMRDVVARQIGGAA